MPKSKLHKLIEIFTCSLFSITLFAMVSNLNASEQVWEYKDWVTQKNDTSVRFMTNGSIVHGHQFGFLKQPGSCSSEILWLSWSTPYSEIKNFESESVSIKFASEESHFQLSLPISYIYELTPNLSIALFTNFVAGNQFISILETGKSIDVSIVSPDEVVQVFDVTKDSFSLDGFIAARLKAAEICEVID